MRIIIESADLKEGPESGMTANVRFRVEGHPQLYEITLYSEDGRAWGYGLHFAGESGREDLIDEVERLLEERDDLFQSLVDAALAAKGKK